MLELLYMQLIHEILEKNIDIDHLPSEKLKSILHVRTYSSIDRKKLDFEIKRLIDKFTEKYGFLGSLVAIEKMRMKTLTLYNLAEDNALKTDIYLLKTACQALYEYIEPYYLINILYKLLFYFRKLKSGSFDEAEFFMTVTKENVCFPKIETEESDQLFLEELERNAEKPSLAKLSEAINLRNRAMQSIQKSIQRDYTPDEVSSYTLTLIDLLGVDLNEERMVITKVLCHAVNLINSKPSSSKRKIDSNQIKMLRFE